jgi:6-phosphofructokinase 1
METIKRSDSDQRRGQPRHERGRRERGALRAQKGLQLMGIKRGYNGLLGLSDNPEDDIEYLDPETVLDIMDMRGTYLRTARCLPFLQPEVRKKAAEDLLRQGIQALVVIGGDGSYHGALELCKLGVPCIGIPGTIDNDLSYTEATLGYDTAVNVCVDAVRSIRATSRSHDRPAVVQVMGRNCGDIAMRTTLATGAEMVIVPEMEWDMEVIADRLKFLISKGNTRATLIISEHCWHKMKPFDWRKVIADSGRVIHDDDTLNADRLALTLKLLCNTEARATVIGYTQRGAIPTAYDSAFAFEAGRTAVELLNCCQREEVFKQGYAIGVRDGRVYYTPFAEALDDNNKKFFDEDLYHMINTL